MEVLRAQTLGCLGPPRALLDQELVHQYGRHDLLAVGEAMLIDAVGEGVDGHAEISCRQQGRWMSTG
eukprot:11189801-Lingulodinium_polyedra.AAC.1